MRNTLGAFAPSRRARVAQWIAIAASTLAAVTCDLVTAPKVDPASTIAVKYAGDTVLTVGTVVPLQVVVTEAGVTLDGARLFLTSSDTTVVAVRNVDLGTDSLIVRSRGAARIRATLVGATLGDAPPFAEAQVRAFASALAFDDSTAVTLRNIGDTLHLRVSVYGRGPAGAIRVDSNPAVQSFTSSNPNIVTVDGRGKLLAHANGVDTITASVDTSRAQIVVRVLQRLARYQYSAPTITLNSLNQDSTFTVVPLDGGGTVIPAATAGLPSPVFTTISQGVVTLQSSGGSGVRLTSVGNGNTKVRIQAGTVDTTLDVTVGQLALSLVIAGPRVDTILALNDTLPLLASAFDAKNIQIRGRGVTWFQQNSAVVRADPASGIVRGVSLGSGKIYAQMDGALDSVTVVVRNVPTSLRITPTVFLTTVHDSLALVDTVFNRLGAPVAGIPVSWRALDTTIAQVGASSGVVEARAAGNTLVIATIAGGAADTASVTIENRVASVRITTPDTALASIGDTVTLRTVLRNARGGALGNSAVQWVSTRPTVVGVQNGFLTALANGISTVYAVDPLNPSRFDSVRVTVTNAPASLTLDRHLDTLRAVGTSLQYTADVRNARGALLASPTVTWHTTNPAVATVSLGGLVTGHATGSVRIFADTAFGGRSVADTATLVIFNDAKTLSVSPRAVTIPSVGASTALIANAANAVGGAVTGVTFLWSSSDPAIATVDTAGIVTGGGVGSAVITVRLGALQDQTSVTVTNAPDTVRFGVAGVTLASAGDTAIPAVRLTNALGAVLPRSAAQWLSDDALIARVTSDGAIIAVSRGTTTVRARNALNTARADSVPVSVTNAPVQLVVAPHLDTLPSIGRTITLAGSAFNGRGQLIPGEPVSWISRDPSTVTVDAATGLVTARGSNIAGTWVVGSVSGAGGIRSDSALLVVRNTAASVSINPGALFLSNVGDSTLLTATALNGLGKVIAGPAVSWSSSNPAVIAFQPTGSGAAVTGPVGNAPDTMRVKALATGTATISAVVDNDTARIGVSVSNPPATVAVTSGNLTLASVGDTVSPSVNVRNALGVALARSAVTWSTSDPTVVTVSGSGLVTATGAGIATITATSPASAALSSSITVTVTNAPASVVLNASSTTLTAIGRTFPYAATVRNAAGGIIGGAPVTWSTSNGAIASVNAQTGVVTALAVGGPVTITATAGTASATAQLGVTNNAVVLSLAPDTTSILALGGTAQLVALGRNDLNNLVPAAVIGFASLDPAIATVSATGLVTATSVAANTGTARIVASVNGASALLADTSYVTVVDAPTTIAITGGPVTLASIGDQATPAATITDLGGAALPRTAVTWSSTAPSVATVSGAGVVTAVSAGTATIRAASPYSPLVSGTVTVTVTNAPSSVALNQTTVTLTALGRTTSFGATVRNARGDPIAGQSVAWSSGNAAVAVDASSGVATAVAVHPGVTITASVVGAPAVTASATVTVTNNPASVSATPSSVVLTSVGGTQALTATARNDLGAAIAGASVGYSSANTAIATVTSPAGVVTATGTGSTTITVDAGGGVTTGVAVTVSNDPATIAITSGSQSLNLNAVFTPTVNFRNGLGASLPITAATWSSSSNAVATVTAAGVLTVQGPGTATITASSPSNPAVTASYTVTVGAPAAGIRLDRTVDSLTAVGRALLYTATVVDANGNPLSGQTVTWSSSNGALVSVTSPGQSATATALAVTGATRVTLTASVTSVLGTATATALVGVGNDPASIVVVPSASSLTSLAQTATLTATVRNNLGNAIGGAAPAWSSANGAIATVTTPGATSTLTAAGVGTTTITAALGGASTTVSVTVTNDPASVAFVGLVNQAMNVTGTFTPTVGAGNQARFQNGLGAFLGLSSVLWSTSDAAIATVSAAGVVTAQGGGIATITAESPANPAVKASYTVTVSAPAALIQLDRTVDSLTAVGRSLLYTATVLDARGNPLAGQSITWTVSNGAQLSITTPGQSATATALAVSGATRDTVKASVTSALGTFVAKAAVGIGNDPASIAISPTSVTLTSLAATTTLNATAYNNLGNPIPGLAAVWSSSAPGIATVSTPGTTATLTAIGVGTTQVTASITSLGSLIATTAVTVRNDLTQLAITPATGTIASVGDTLFPAVVFKNALNAVLPRTAATWSSSNPAIATVTSDGVITGVAAGVDTVVAQSPANSAIRDSIFVTVTNAAASVVLNTTRDTMTAVGQSFQPSATVRNARNAVISGASVTWGTTNAGVAAVATDGTITATGFGTAIVFAASGAAPADSDTVVVVGNSHPMVLWVNKDAAGPARLGTRKAPYAGIQAAANAAGTGDTIYVMKAATPYNEALSLTSGVVLAGSPTDASNAGCSATAYCAPALLPVLAHTFGAAAITASAGTSVSVRNLAITHGVDGAAVDANGADLDAENVFVNPAGVVGTPALPTGRGLWVRSAPDSARIRRVQVRNVKGYGVRLESSSARVDTVVVTAVDSASGFGSRAGVHVIGGSGVRVANTTILATGATIGTMDGIRLSGVSAARIVRDSVDSGRYGLRADNSTFLDSNLAVRQAVTGLRLEGNASHTSEHARFGRTTDVGVEVSGTGNVSILRRARFDSLATAQTDSLAIDVQASATDAQLTVDSSAFDLGAGRAVRMQAGASLSMTRDTILGDSTRTGTVLDSTLAVIVTTGLSGNALVRRTLVTDFARRYAMAIGAAGTVTMDSNLVARNRAGVHLASAAGSYTLAGNDIYDQRGAAAVGMSAAAGFAYSKTSQLGNWWGDDRGPRRLGLTATSADSVATGDSVPVGGGRFATGDFAGSLQTTPTFAGAGAAGLHLVRGTGQTLASSVTASPAPLALTVRVVDASGRPVSGASVAAAITSTCTGDDLGAGACTAPAPVTTNASGLAEFTLTVAGGAHAVTVGVTAASKTVTFTVNRP